MLVPPGGMCTVLCTHFVWVSGSFLTTSHLLQVKEKLELPDVNLDYGMSSGASVEAKVSGILTDLLTSLQCISNQY
ncbi:hypothetical protein AMEX_G26959 [Astyanax mexicanus]|uniref:Uncharacterized protein n=1 Tax=Astyanax mexicanus TaxID=7994 RepID=A0A8T2KV65_ASTMX|nr:hypothetical protein AMEX_G26959 [Astyanax mexicanus]